MIQDGQLSAMGLNQRSRFDRIDVSNILDPNYVGLKATLADWAPILSRQKHAALVGYFMNWFLVQKDGRVTGAGMQTMSTVMKKIAERLKVSEAVVLELRVPTILTRIIIRVPWAQELRWVSPQLLSGFGVLRRQTCRDCRDWNIRGDGGR
jgi:hypothetical protein